MTTTEKVDKVFSDLDSVIESLEETREELSTAVDDYGREWQKSFNKERELGKAWQVYSTKLAKENEKLKTEIQSYKLSRLDYIITLVIISCITFSAGLVINSAYRILR